METKIVKTRHSDVYSECCDTQTLRKLIDTNISLVSTKNKRRCL